MNTSIAFSNPEYMSLDEILNLINEYKRTKNINLNESVNKFKTLPAQRPPHKRPPSPPRTPPPILHRKYYDPLPLYQNVPYSINQVYSETSSDATMIVRDSITPPKPLMTSSRINLNSFQKKLTANKCKSIHDTHEDFSILEEEVDGESKIVESTRIKVTSSNENNEKEFLNENNPKKENTICCCFNNPNYCMFKLATEQYSSHMNINEELSSPNESLIYKFENFNFISPPSPFKEGSSTSLDDYIPNLSPSKNCLLNLESAEKFNYCKEIFIEKFFCCHKNCISFSSESSDSCSSTSTSGYKSNQSNVSNVSINSTNMIHQVELNHFIEMNMRRLERLKTKRMQLISNSNSSILNSIKSNGI